MNTENDPWEEAQKQMSREVPPLEERLLTATLIRDRVRTTHIPAEHVDPEEFERLMEEIIDDDFPGLD